MPRVWRILTVGAVTIVAACATLSAVVQPPQFETAARDARLRLLAPSAENPLGGAAVRLWARVYNPNAFGLRITSLDGDLFLEGERAAEVALPLGLPLAAEQDTVIPLELSIGLADVPGLADAAVRALTGGALAYRLDGSFSVDAGPLGELGFGPMRLLQGEVEVTR